MKSISLEKGIIHLMLPFRLGSVGSSDTTLIESELWVRTDEDVPKLDFLLDHVKDFFIRNTLMSNQDVSSCLILKIKADALPVKLFNNKVYWVSNKAFDTHEKARNLLKFPVIIDPASFRIIFHPFARVGILVFSVEMSKSGKNIPQPDLGDFIQMNYLLRLFNRQNEAFFISQNDRPEERSKANQLLIENSLNMSDKSEAGNIEQSGWRPKHLVNYLLNGLNQKYKVELFDHNRFSPVCYAQTTEEITDEKTINLALFYLRKVYDFNYTPAPGVLQSEEELFHPFKQIYYSTSLEGAVVFNNCGPSDPEFVKSFYSNSFQKSIWLNILSSLQRSIFLQLMKEVSDVDPDDPKMIKEYLKRYTSISLKAIFSKVSVYHQHNDYYNLITHNLQITDLQLELKDELHELNNIQRQYHDDEVEKNDELEKQYDKRLNVILFILSVFGLTELIYKVLDNSSMTLFHHILAFGIPVLLGIVFWKILSLQKK
jgi:hypothetical protein